MFAVIFKATVAVLDQEYLDTVEIMRDLAFSKYGCLDFVSLAEGNKELSISYWQSESDIQRWHEDAKHKVAQRLGRERWYESYVVEVVEIKRKYYFPRQGI